MSDDNIHEEHPQPVQEAATPSAWREAPPPNYQTNVNLKFPYSEYPRTFGSKSDPYGYPSTQLGRQTKGRILDFWGEGRIVDGTYITGFANSYNVNHQFQLVSNGPDEDKKIPNRIPTIDYEDVSVAKYVPDGSFDTITLMGSPLTPATAAEMARIISGDNSVIVIYGFEENSPEITALLRALDSKSIVPSRLYALSHTLREVGLPPRLAFCPGSQVLAQATTFFTGNDMASCATVLCSLYKASNIQSSARSVLSSFFSQNAVRNSPLIFKLGYELKLSATGLSVMSQYMNANVMRIVMQDYSGVQLVASLGTTAYLFPEGKVSSGSWQYAYFGTSEYLGTPNYQGSDQFVLVPTRSKLRFQIQSTFGSESYLCTESVSSNSWQRAFFGTPSYLNSPSYQEGQFFYLVPVDGGAKFMVQSNFGVSAYLTTESVSAGGHESAWFGSTAYLSGHPSYQGEVLTLSFV